MTKTTKNRKQPKKRRGWSREKRDRVRRENEQMLVVLQSIQPRVFSRESPLPLAIGIHSSIRKSLPGASGKAIQRFLKWWTNRPAYHEAVSKSAFRTMINGMNSGPIEFAQVEHSKKAMERRPKSKKKKPAAK